MRLLTLAFLFCIGCVLHSQTIVSSPAAILPDTLKVYVDDNGDPYFLHKTIVQTELSRIAFTFGCSLKTLQRANPQVTQKIVAQGDVLVIPLETEQITHQRSDTIPQIPVLYWVQPGETVFRISRVYFEMPADLLMYLNRLATTTIPVGKSLLIGWFGYYPQRMYAEVLVGDAVLASERNKLDPFYSDTPVAAAGVAYWNKDSTDAGHLFAMHRTARINSHIEITNPMYHEKVMVKVVGRIPVTYPDDISVIISPGVARALGAIDARFRVEMRYVE